MNPTYGQVDDAYAPLNVLHDIGAEVVFVADVETQLLGDEPVWDRVAVVKYLSRRSFIEMQSRPDFVKKHEHKNAGMQQTIVSCCLPIPSPGGNSVDSADVAHPPTEDDPHVVVLHVLKFDEAPATDVTPDEMAAYQEAAGEVAIPHGVRIDGWFAVEGTIVGDGRSWDQMRFNKFPSRAAFMAVVTDPKRLEAQGNHREVAIADTYTMILRPSINLLAESVIG